MLVWTLGLSICTFSCHRVKVHLFFYWTLAMWGYLRSYLQLPLALKVKGCMIKRRGMSKQQIPKSYEAWIMKPAFHTMKLLKVLVLQINESRLFEGTNGMRPEHHLSLSLLWSFLYNKVGHWITTFNHVCMYIGRKKSCFQFVNWFTL